MEAPWTLFEEVWYNMAPIMNSDHQSERYNEQPNHQGYQTYFKAGVAVRFHSSAIISGWRLVGSHGLQSLTTSCGWPTPALLIYSVMVIKSLVQNKLQVGSTQQSTLLKRRNKILFICCCLLIATMLKCHSKYRTRNVGYCYRIFPFLERSSMVTYLGVLIYLPINSSHYEREHFEG